MDKQRTSGQVDRALYDTVVRRYFAEKSAREELENPRSRDPRAH